MTSWNDIRFLQEAVRGVLAQTMPDFELIIVDNGSDHAAEHAALAALDRRIRLLRIDHNVGPAEGGNRGIALARAPLIARMDSDDCAEPGWLAACAEALAANPQLGLVGTWATLVNEHGDPIGVDRTPESDFAIRFTLLSHNPFYHSSTVYRRELFDLVGGSESSQHLTHDHRLWRAMLPHCRARNLPQALCRYRYNPRGLTGSADPRTARSRSRDIRVGLWEEIGLDYPLDDRALADAVDDFLRDRPCRSPELWGEVSRVIEAALAGTARLAGSSCLERDEPFESKLRQRLARGPRPPPGPVMRAWRALQTRGVRRFLAALARRVGAG